MRVLIVEDQARTAAELRSGLVNAGFEAVVATTVEEALPLAQSGVFEALVVDIMLPGRSGLDLVEALRAAGHPVPIIILSAKGNLEDRLRGLEAGADDYLAKPYSILEVVARLRTITRRAQPVMAAPVQVADLVWDPARRSVARGGKRIELTPKEYALMVLLLEHAGRVVPRSQLVKAVWGLEGAVDANAVDVQILRLRRKVDDPFPLKLIHTLRGVGLVLEPREAD
ncbi:MAG: response regulator transcription factor [Acidobacteriota bacterium]|nr:response regulator transcription factor [Acidobacteriota bacterium]